MTKLLNGIVISLVIVFAGWMFFNTYSNFNSTSGGVVDSALSIAELIIGAYLCTVSLLYTDDIVKWVNKIAKIIKPNLMFKKVASK